MPCGTALPVARWVTNNGGWEGTYAASVAQRQAAPATTAPGAFANGATVGKQEEQFSSNLEVVNSQWLGRAQQLSNHPWPSCDHRQ